MTTTIEAIKEFAREVVLDGAKRNLVAHGELEPMVFLFDGEQEGRVFAMPIPTPSEEEKRENYVEAAKCAFICHAHAAITVNDAYMKKHDAATPEQAKAAMDAYVPGQLSKDYAAVECIIVGIKGPGFKPLTITQQYLRNGVGDIEFGELIETKEGDCEINILPDWWGFTTKGETK